jgi:hypothetical protein
MTPPSVGVGGSRINSRRADLARTDPEPGWLAENHQRGGAQPQLPFFPLFSFNQLQTKKDGSVNARLRASWVNEAFSQP